MTFRYHGNYCGPGWSDGKYQSSVIGTVEPIDELDLCCKQHDSDIYLGLDSADDDFFDCALPIDPLAAYSVRIYGALAKLNKMTKLRGAKKAQKPSNPNAPNQAKNDTKIIAPMSIATKRTGKAPKMENAPDGTVRVSHRAFINPVTCSSTFAVDRFSCNPGLSGSFPWLAQLANKYDEYRFTKLRYSYRSVTATSTSGVVMMSFDYDASDSSPTSKSQQAQTVPHSECNAWATNDLSVKVDNSWRYVRPGNLASNLDIKTYDIGTLFVSSVYGTGVVTGELYVEYSVELRKPSAGNLGTGRIFCTPSAFTTPIVNPVVSGYPPVEVLSSTTLRFITSGEFMFVLSAVGTGIATTPPTPTIATTGQGVVSSMYTILASGFGTSENNIKVRANFGDVLTFASAGTGTTITQFNIRIAICEFDTM